MTIFVYLSSIPLTLLSLYTLFPSLHTFSPLFLLFSLCPASSPSPLALNTGLTAWLQKYRAMVVKRMYTSFRFWQAMISHLVLPLTHVIYAMVLASTLLFNDNPSDPKRSLSLSKSALSDNRTLFWAEFHDGVVNGDVTGNMSSFFDFQVSANLTV